MLKLKNMAKRNI